MYTIVVQTKVSGLYRMNKKSPHSLFIEEVHKRPKDSLCIHSGITSLGRTFHLDQLLVHLLHTILDDRFETEG